MQVAPQDESVTATAETQGAKGQSLPAEARQFDFWLGSGILPGRVAMAPTALVASSTAR